MIDVMIKTVEGSSNLPKSLVKWTGEVDGKRKEHEIDMDFGTYWQTMA